MYFFLIELKVEIDAPQTEKHLKYSPIYINNNFSVYLFLNLELFQGKSKEFHNQAIKV